MPLNVMVVDDSGVMRAMMVRTLRTSRLPLREIHEAADGEQALALLDAHWIDLALVDLNMPGMSGEELIRAIRSNPATAELAILVVSAEDRESRLACVRAQHAAFLQKPFTLDALRTEVQRLTGARPVEQVSAHAPETVLPG